MAGRAEVVSVEEASERLGVCRNTGYALARRGVIPALRLGRRLVVPRRALAAMLADPRGWGGSPPAERQSGEEAGR